MISWEAGLIWLGSSGGGLGWFGGGFGFFNGLCSEKREQLNQVFTHENQ